VNFIKYFLLSITLLFTAFSVWMAFLPETHEIQRTQKLEVPVEAAFEKLSDLKNLPNWVTWFNPDSLQLSYSGPTTGTGAAVTFVDGHTNGTLRLTEVVSPSKISYEILYNGKTGATGAWLLEPAGANASQLTWTFNGSMPYFLRWVNLTIDKRVGADLEANLVKAKDFVENQN
jgi:carbon monoxide dehydrogenase subunit G